MPLDLADLGARGLVAPDWAAALEPVADDVRLIGERLDDEVEAGRGYQPAEEDVFRAFRRPLAEVRVLIVGQDPYPNPAYPIGLSFAVERHVRPLPDSLRNIYRELETDLGLPPAAHGDLSAWSDRGVMLLNRVLTVRPHEAGAHERWGWEAVTDRAIGALAERDAPLVAILWGGKAGVLETRFPPGRVIRSAHPSPLSARRGFFGSRPFSRANALLEEQGAPPVDWRLPE